jgi:predicted dehydrogenase
MSKLRAALIGAGHMGRYHAGKLAACEDVTLATIVDTNGERASALAAQHGCAAHTDWRSCLEGVDLACVAVPTERHHEVARAFLEAGAHVLIEKPLTRTLEEADDLVALARAKKRLLGVGHVERFNPAFGALARRMRRPLYIEAERLSGFKQRGADVDVVLDLMIHDLDLVLALARSPLTHVSACGFRVLTNAVDIANARLEFASGCIANLSASRVSQAPVRKLRVFQPDLYVSADLQAGRLRFAQEDGGAITETEERFEVGDPLAAHTVAFVDAVRRGSAPPVSGEDGRSALAVALQVGELVRERLACQAGAGA